MMIVRVLLCDECEHEWKEFCDSSDPVPDCPVCDALAKRIPNGFAITTTKAKAIDIAQSVAEHEFGLTNMRDNTQIGETAALPIPEYTAAEQEAFTRQMMEVANVQGAKAAEAEAAAKRLRMDGKNSFWAGGANPQTPLTPEVVQGLGTMGAMQARAEGTDPIDLLHTAGKKGVLGPQGMRLEVIASDRKPRKRAVG